MTGISATDIKKLRDITGAGMMECKSALTEANGDIEAAIDLLRKKGLALAASKSGRTAADGVVALCLEPQKGSLIELNTETDFVARNPQFQDVAQTLAKHACETQKDLDALLASNYPGTERTVHDLVTELVATIKENIQLRRVKHLKVNKGAVAGYIHNTLGPNLGKIGVIVALESDAPTDQLMDMGKKIAMHIAAAKPHALTIEQLDPTKVEREKAIYAEQARESGRPEDIIAKMIEGRVRKFYEEVVLLEQVFVLDSKLKVKEFIESKEKELGTKINLTDYGYFVLGEGVEKE